MKKICKSLSFVIVALLVLAFSFGGVNFNRVNAEGYPATDGVTFSANEYYEVTKKLEKMPQTFEAEIYLPVGLSGRIGCIFSNYNDGLSPCISFDMVDGGKPCLYYNTPNGTTWNRVVNSDLRRDSWVHLAITNDQEKNEFICYVDGVKVDSVISSTYADDIAVNFVIGGDNSSDNSSYFKGRIRSLALYSDVRSQSEIASDFVNGADTADENAIAVYDMPASSAQNDLEDLTGNGYNVNYGKAFYTQKPAVENYAYSFAAIGDTQNITEDEPTKLSIIYDWLLANKETKKIAHVFGLGDITDMNTEEEWRTAKSAISKLNGQIPYSLVRGNHDITYMYNKTFNNKTYTSQFGGFYDESKIENSWKTMTVGNTDYLFITLDYGACDEVLSWASRIIEAFPTHKVIITTHAYMYADGTTIGEGDEVIPSDATDTNYAPTLKYNDGDAMWDKLISKHGNIFLVMSGHVSCNNLVTTQRKGIHGNTVTEMLIDPQEVDKRLGATGMVAMLYFSEDGNFIDVEYYSTVKEGFYKETNQYRVNIVDKETVAHTTPANWEYNATYHWGKCSSCGIIFAEEHTLGEWVVIKEPAPGVAGEKRQSCECGYYKVGEIPALPDLPDDSSSDSAIDSEGSSNSQGGGAQAPSGGGCGSSIGVNNAGLLFALLCVGGASLLLRKRK